MPTYVCSDECDACGAQDKPACIFAPPRPDMTRLLIKPNLPCSWGGRE
jgi:hypothetical protein